MAPFIRGVSDFRSPPYRFDNFTSTTLTVPACQSKLQAVCDKYLNGPLKRTSPNVFVATTPTILLTFCRFRQAESIPEVSIGYLNYQEVSVVFGVKDIKHNEHFMYGWVLFLDGPEANTAEYFASPPVVTGRELFGLPKLRGEISFDPDLLTGELRCVYPSASKIVMKLDLCIRVEHPLQCRIRRILDELLIIEEQQGQTRSLEKLTPEEHRNQLVEQHRALTRELEKLRQRRPFGKRHHPLALAYKFFGNDVTSIIRDQANRAEIERAFEILQQPGAIGDEDEVFLQHALQTALEIGFLQELSIMKDKYACQLVGLRQVHNPVNFAHADLQQVVVSDLQYDEIALALTEEYCVTFFSQSMRDELGLPQQVLVEGTDAFGHGGPVTAIYGAKPRLISN